MAMVGGGAVIGGDGLVANVAPGSLGVIGSESSDGEADGGDAPG